MKPRACSTSAAGGVGTSSKRLSARLDHNKIAARLRRHEATTRLHGDDGFTVAEVIVSIALFTIMSIAVLFALVTIVKFTGVTQNRVAASNLARQEIERLRGQSSTLSALDSTASTVTLKGTTYTVTPVLNPSVTDSCAPGAERAVTVTVTWPDSGARSVRYDTVLTC